MRNHHHGKKGSKIKSGLGITDMNAVTKDEDTSCSLDDMNCEGK